MVSRLQIHKAAQLGLKPAPNSRGLDWAAFGAPPAAGEHLPPSQNRTKYRDVQEQMDATRGSRQGAGQHGRAAVAGGQTVDTPSGCGVAQAESCQSPHTAAASAAGPHAVTGLPRSVALQQQQQQHDPQKRLRAVQKKLRQIAALEEKRCSGAVQLLPEELAKLEQKAALEAEALQLQTALNALS